MQLFGFANYFEKFYKLFKSKSELSVVWRVVLKLPITVVAMSSWGFLTLTFRF